MKLSEMNTDQMAKCLCELVSPVAEIVADDGIWEALKEFGSTTGKTLFAVAGSIAVKITPLLLRDHYKACVEIVSAMTGKTPAVIRKQSGMQTIADVVGFIDKDLIDFFKSSAPTGKTV